MVKKPKVQKITFKSIFRFSLFIIIIFILINFLNKQQKSKNKITDPTIYVGEKIGGQILGEIYPKFPQNSRYQLEHIGQTFLGKIIKNSSSYVKNQLNGFPQKQIKQFKKDLINKISQDLINDIDNQ